MFNEKQWNIVLKILKRISKRQICSDYGVSYWYLMRYVTGSSPRTSTMDQKILTMLLDMQDDNFELIQEINKKSKKKL